MYGFCIVCGWVSMGFVTCKCVYVWVFLFVGVCMYGFRNVCLCECMGYVMCRCVYVRVL